MTDKNTSGERSALRESVRMLSSMHMEAVKTPTSLDMPRRYFHPLTGLASLTSLFTDVGALLEDQQELTLAYIHLPNSEIVEDRYGWEAHEAFVGMCANYLNGVTARFRKDRGNALLIHAFADDYVLFLPHHPDDEQLEAHIADGMVRHLSAMDRDLASVSKIYVGLETVRQFPRIHNERLIYRGILESAARAQDVGQRELMAQARILDRVLKDRAFVMHYQPIVTAESPNIYGYEALVRCTAPELKSPLVLFDIAERSGRIRPLNRSLRQITIESLPDLPDPEFMFINLHVDDFEDPELLDPPPLMREYSSRIILEVTERAAIRDFDKFKANLKIMRDHGFLIAIDDMGSGYSALHTVAEVEPDLIKFDMALIRGIDTNTVRQNLVRNIRAFADDLGVKVVAEGVETEGEYQACREIGCHLIQGYYFARPSLPFIRDLEH